LTFAEKTGLLLLDKIKTKLGCAICTTNHDPLDLTFWSASRNGPVDDHKALLMQHDDVLNLGVVCLDCIIKVQELKVPPIRRMPTEPR
jgi:hypothetical protein